MADTLTQKLMRHGWPEDEAPVMMDEALLEKTEGFIDNDNEYTTWTEWRLYGKIIKRGAHVKLKRSVLAEGLAGMFGQGIELDFGK